jgi:hypothetical protein
MGGKERETILHALHDELLFAQIYLYIFFLFLSPSHKSLPLVDSLIFLSLQQKDVIGWQMVFPLCLSSLLPQLLVQEQQMLRCCNYNFMDQGLDILWNVEISGEKVDRTRFARE